MLDVNGPAVSVEVKEGFMLRVSECIPTLLRKHPRQEANGPLAWKGVELGPCTRALCSSSKPISSRAGLRVGKVPKCCIIALLHALLGLLLPRQYKHAREEARELEMPDQAKRTPFLCHSEAVCPSTYLNAPREGEAPRTWLELQ